MILKFQERIAEDIGSLVHFFRELEQLESELHYYSENVMKQESKDQKSKVIERDASYNSVG